MEMTVWNSPKQRLTTMDVEFTKENTTWFEEYAEEHDIHKITDVDGGILISQFGYGYPVWIYGASRADIGYSRHKAVELIELYALH
jgi:prophage tail gpP-like protein